MGGGESVTVRSQLNSAAVSMWQDSPVFGAGMGNFLVALPKYLFTREIYFLQPVHNIYFLVLSETGIIGLTLFISLLIKIFWGFTCLPAVMPFVRGFLPRRGGGVEMTTDNHRKRLNYEKKNNEINHFKKIFKISLGILLLLGLVDHYPLTLQQGQILLTVLAGMAY